MLKAMRVENDFLGNAAVTYGFVRPQRDNHHQLKDLFGEAERAVEESGIGQSTFITD